MFQKNVGKPGRKRRAQRIAIARCVFHGNEPVLASNAHADRAPGVRQFVNHRGDFRVYAARSNFRFSKVAEL